MNADSNRCLLNAKARRLPNTKNADSQNWLLLTRRRHLRAHGMYWSRVKPSAIFTATAHLVTCRQELEKLRE